MRHTYTSAPKTSRRLMPFLAGLCLCLGVSTGHAQVLTSDFVNAGYTLLDLGSITDLPTNYGGLTMRSASYDTLYIGGAANQATGAVYKVPVVRDVNTQGITGFAGPAILHAPAPNIDGGLSFAPNGTMLYTRFSMNELGQRLTDGTTLSTPLTPLGIMSSVGSHGFVPAGHPGAGNLIVASYNGWALYNVPYTINSDGSYGLAAPTAQADVSGTANGPEGIAYVPLGSPSFPNPSMVISAYGMGKVVVFDVDNDGLPVTSTARDMVTGLTGAEGAFIDPLTGDFLFSTFSGSNRVIRVSGFQLPTGSQELTRPIGVLPVWPNPTRDVLRLGLDAKQRIEAVEVIDARGRIALRVGRPADNTIDLRSLRNGVYTVLVRTEDGVHTARVVRE